MNRGQRMRVWLPEDVGGRRTHPGLVRSRKWCLRACAHPIGTHPSCDMSPMWRPESARGAERLPLPRAAAVESGSRSSRLQAMRWPIHARTVQHRQPDVFEVDVSSSGWLGKPRRVVLSGLWWPPATASVVQTIAVQIGGLWLLPTQENLVSSAWRSWRSWRSPI